MNEVLRFVPCPSAFIAFRKGAGVVELAALEMLCTSKGYRGFESHPFRHSNFSLMILILDHEGQFSGDPKFEI